MLGEGRPQLGRLLREVLVERVDVAVGVDELGGRLVPHSRDSRKIVGRVAPKRRQERVELRADTRAFFDAGLVVEDVIGHASTVVENLDERVANKLVGVAITRDDHDLVPIGRKTGGKSSDHVVSLVALCIDRRDSESLDEPANELELLHQRLWGLRPTGLVGRGEGVAERRLTSVERYRHPRRRLVLQQPREHGGEAEDRLGLLARSCRELCVLQGEPRPVRERVAVQEKVASHRVHAKASRHAARRNVALGTDCALDDLLRDLAHRGPLVHRRLLDEREGLGLPHAFLVHELALGPVDPPARDQLLFEIAFVVGEGGILGLESLHLVKPRKGHLDSRQQLVLLEGLDQISERPSVAGLLDEIALAESREDEHRRSPVHVYLTRRRQPVESRHLDVQDHQVGSVLLGQLHGFVPAAGLTNNVKALLFENLTQI